MKRVLTGAIVLTLSFTFLSACGDSATQASVQPTLPQTNAPTASPTPSAEEPDTRGIIGSHMTDIRMGMTQFGFEEPSIKNAPEEVRDYYAYSCSTLTESADLDASLDYSITADTEFQIVGGTFGISWSANGENSDFVSSAQIYLGFVSSIPYDEADTASAKQWVLDNVPSVADGESCSTTIGDAKFELYGTKLNDNYTSFILDIAKAE